LGGRRSPPTAGIVLLVIVTFWGRGRKLRLNKPMAGGTSRVRKLPGVAHPFTILIFAKSGSLLS